MREMESARAIESLRMLLMFIESGRAIELVSRRMVESVRIVESRRIVESVVVLLRVVADVLGVVERVGVVTSPVDSFVTRTRRCEVARRVVSDVERRVESDVARRVVSVCADAVEVAPNTSAIAAALANDNRRFIHSSPHCRHSYKPRGRLAGGASIVGSLDPGSSACRRLFPAPVAAVGGAPSGYFGRCTTRVESIRRAAESRGAVASAGIA
jgi:hypothetical protein